MPLTDHEEAVMKWNHYVKYRDMLGSMNLSHRMPSVPREELIRCAHEDEHLNNIPLAKWDAEARPPFPFPTSLSERVCLLKHYARYHIAGISPPPQPQPLTSPPPTV